MRLHIITFGVVLFFALTCFQPSVASEAVSPTNQTNLSYINNVDEQENELILLSLAIENQIQKATAILELTSKLPEMRTLSYINQFSTVHNGIPASADIEKRQIGQEILSKFPDEFVSFLYLMPNGTVYLLEPYARQQNLSNSDLSHRDYYKGMIKTNNTFLGNVITSLSSGRNQAQLIVPIFDNANDSIIGAVSSGLNFENYNKILQSINLGNQQRIVLVDSNGTKIADSDKSQPSSLLNTTHKDTSYRNLQSFKNAVKGEKGALIESVNGSNTEIQYKPIKAVQNNWVLLLFQSSGTSTVPANSSLSHADNTTMSIHSNETMPNSNITNKSSSLNTTLPNELPPESINGSKAGKI
jgi:Cache domain